MCSMYATLRGSKGKLHTPGFQSLEGLIVAIPQLRRTNAMLSILLCRAAGLSKEHLQPMKQPPFSFLAISPALTHDLQTSW